MKTKTPAQLARLNAKLDVQIAAKNAAFEKATPAQKRVMIAKDVLERLATKQVKPEQGDWVSFPTLVDTDDDLDPSYGGGNEAEYQEFRATSLQDQIVKQRVQCTCCALGGLLTSCVAVKNDFTVDQFMHGEMTGSDAIDGTDSVGLSKVFSQSQLKLIEFVFESGEGYVSKDNEVYLASAKQEEAARAFIKRYPKVKDRYRAIFQNVVRNNGTFAP